MKTLSAGEIDQMSDAPQHPVIYLEPEPPADPDYGRMWAHNDVWEGRSTKYLLASDMESALTAARIEGARAGLERAAKIAETGHGYGGQSIAEFIRKALKESFL